MPPPEWHQAPACEKCGKKFSMLARKHHCRNCGGTFCQEDSKWTAALPHFDLLDQERVCENCFNKLKTEQSSGKAGAKSAAPPAVATEEPAARKASEAASPPARVVNCKCNMPLCVCHPEEASKDEEKKDAKKAPSSAAKAARPAATSSATAPAGGFFFSSQTSTATTRVNLEGDLNEQCRDAIKSGDLGGVKALLEAKADPGYVDKTGSSLAHLAAMFNRFDIIQLLVARGATLSAKNAGGETPIEIAPPALQHKMRELVK